MHEFLRYPKDLHDRIWRRDGYPDSTASYKFENITNVNDNSSENTMPPLEVLQTALTHQERLHFQYENLDVEPRNYALYLYFLELNSSVKAKERVFEVYINNETTEVDIMASGSPYLAVNLNFTANGAVNLTLVRASSSQLGPICNGYEIFQVYPRNEEANVDEGN